MSKIELFVFIPDEPDGKPFLITNRREAYYHQWGTSERGAVFRAEIETTDTEKNTFELKEWQVKRQYSNKAINLLSLLVHEAVRLGAGDPYEEFQETLDETYELLGYRKERKDGD